jgi:hypothetical protein
MITHYLCSKCGELRGASILECPCQPRQLHDPRIFGAAKVGSDPVPQPPSDRFKGGVFTPYGYVSFHSEYEAARDYIWDVVSEKLVRERAAVNNKGPHQ